MSGRPAYGNRGGNGRPVGSKNKTKEAFINQPRIYQKYVRYKSQANAELIERLCFVLEIDYEKYARSGAVVSLWGSDGL